MSFAISSSEYWIGGLSTAVVTLLGVIVKSFVDLRKAAMVQNPVDAQTVFTGYNNLFQELKTQITELKVENMHDRVSCEERIKALEVKHSKELLDHKTVSAKENRELRLRLAHVEQLLSQYQEKDNHYRVTDI